MGWNTRLQLQTQGIVKRSNYTDATASFDGINTKQTHKAASGTYAYYNTADIAGQWFKLE